MMRYGNTEPAGQRRANAHWSQTRGQGRVGTRGTDRLTEAQTRGGEGQRPPNRGSCCSARAATLKQPGVTSSSKKKAGREDVRMNVSYVRFKVQPKPVFSLGETEAPRKLKYS